MHFIFGESNAANGTPEGYLVLSPFSQLTLLHCTERTKRKREPFSTVPFSRDPDFVDRPNISA